MHNYKVKKNKKDVFCQEQQIFDKVKVEELVDYFLNDHQVKISYKKLRKGPLFGVDKLKRATALYNLYKYSNLHLDKPEEIKAICATKQNVVKDAILYINFNNISRYFQKVIFLKTIFIKRGDIILNELSKTLYDILEQKYKNQGYIDKIQINQIIFFYLIKLINLFKTISSVQLDKRHRKKERRRSYNLAILKIEKIIKNFLEEIKNSKKILEEFDKETEETNLGKEQIQIYQEMKEIIQDTSLNTVVIDFWELLAEYVRYAFSLRGAYLLINSQDKPIVSIAKFAILNEFLNENFLVRGGNFLSPLFKEQIELLDNTSEIIFTILLTFGGIRILGIGSDIKIAIRDSSNNYLLGGFYHFFKLYLARFVKYNILDLFDFTEKQIDALGKIYNFYNILNSKDSGVVHILHRHNLSLSHLIKRRNSSKLSSLIHNNFNFYKKIKDKQYKVNINFSSILTEELGLDIEQILSDELSNDISCNTDDILYMIMEENMDALKIVVKTIFLLVKIIKLVNPSLLKYINQEVDYDKLMEEIEKEDISNNIDQIKILLLSLEDNLRELNENLDVFTSFDIEDILELKEANDNEIQEEIKNIIFKIIISLSKKDVIISKLTDFIIKNTDKEIINEIQITNLPDIINTILNKILNRN